MCYRFRVHWGGTHRGETTWQPEEDVRDCQAYKAYMAKLKALAASGGCGSDDDDDDDSCDDDDDDESDGE